MTLGLKNTLYRENIANWKTVHMGIPEYSRYELQSCAFRNRTPTVDMLLQGEEYNPNPMQVEMQVEIFSMQVECREHPSPAAAYMHQLVWI